MKVLIAFYIVMQKSGNILNKKNIKITKKEHAFKYFSSTCND